MRKTIRWGLPGLLAGLVVTAALPARDQSLNHSAGASSTLKTDHPDQTPKVVRQVRPEYPLSQRMAGFNGEVLVRFVVDTAGRVRNPYVVRSSNPGFDQSAIKAILQWRFKPGLKAGYPVNCRMQVPILFQLDGGGDDAFTVQTSKKFQKTLPPEFQFETAPRLTGIQPAVYPFAALLAKQRGTVEFSFAVDTRGGATLVKVYKSPGDAFTGAVQAMVDVMRFKPALKAGKPTYALLSMKLKFDDRYGQVPVSDDAEDLLRAIRKAGGVEKAVPMSELDSPVQALSQRPPVFPRALRGKLDHGEATVAFIIDEHGLVELPRIVSASDPAFGYAACQAVAAWRFKPAEHAGRTVPVSVEVPFDFKLK